MANDLPDELLDALKDARNELIRMGYDVTPGSGLARAFDFLPPESPVTDDMIVELYDTAWGQDNTKDRSKKLTPLIREQCERIYNSPLCPIAWDPDHALKDPRVMVLLEATNRLLHNPADLGSAGFEARRDARAAVEAFKAVP